MSILSWLFGAPGWLLAGGLILVAVFGLVPSISKWLWVACIVAVGAWGAVGYGKAARQARHTHEAGDKLLQAEQSLRTAGGDLHTAAREIEVRDRMLRQIEADAARRTRNADAARRAAAAQIATLRQRAAATQAYVPKGDTPAARAEDAAAQWLKARGQ